MIAAPITGEDGPLGVIEVYAVRPDAFDETDAALIRRPGRPGRHRHHERPPDRGARRVAHGPGSHRRGRTDAARDRRRASPRCATRTRSSRRSSMPRRACSRSSGAMIDLIDPADDAGGLAYRHTDARLQLQPRVPDRGRAPAGCRRLRHGARGPARSSGAATTSPTTGSSTPRSATRSSRSGHPVGHRGAAAAARRGHRRDHGLRRRAGRASTSRMPRCSPAWPTRPRSPSPTCASSPSSSARARRRPARRRRADAARDRRPRVVDPRPDRGARPDRRRGGPPARVGRLAHRPLGRRASSLCWAYSAGDAMRDVPEWGRTGGIKPGQAVAGTGVRRPAAVHDRRLPGRRPLRDDDPAIEKFIREAGIRAVIAVPLTGEDAAARACCRSCRASPARTPRPTSRRCRRSATHASIAIMQREPHGRARPVAGRRRATRRGGASAAADRRPHHRPPRARRGPPGVVDEARRLLRADGAVIDQYDPDSGHPAVGVRRRAPRRPSARRSSSTACGSARASRARPSPRGASSTSATTWTAEFDHDDLADSLADWRGHPRPDRRADHRRGRAARRDRGL